MAVNSAVWSQEEQETVSQEHEGRCIPRKFTDSYRSAAVYYFTDGIYYSWKGPFVSSERRRQINQSAVS